MNKFCSLGEVCQHISYGVTTSAVEIKDGPRLLRITDITGDGVNWENVPGCNISEKEEAKSKLLDGDIVIARTGGTVGKSFLLKNPPSAVCASYLLRLRPKQSLILSDYLNLFLGSTAYWSQLQAAAQGAAQPNVNSTTLSKLILPVPELSDQRRIAAQLKAQLAEVEKARKAAEAQLSEISILLDLAIDEAISETLSKGDRSVFLGDIANISSKLVDPTLPEMKVLPHVSAENIVSITGELINMQSAAEDGMKSNKYFFDAGDVLYSKLRPYLRKVALPDFCGLCSADMYPLKVDSKAIDPEFLKILLTSKLFTEYANEKSARSRMPKLNREQLFGWEFTLPPLKHQKTCVEKIIRILEHSNTAEKAARKIIADVTILPSKLLSKAFEIN